MINWIMIVYYLKRAKYYACITIIGLFAINYYFMRFFFSNFVKFGSKIKDNSVVSIVVFSLILILLEVTFIEITWNSNNLQISVPLLSNK